MQDIQGKLDSTDACSFARTRDIPAERVSAGRETSPTKVGFEYSRQRADMLHAQKTTNQISPCAN